MTLRRTYDMTVDEVIRALVVWSGVTTANGAPGGTTLIDAALIGVNDFITDKTILILGGNAAKEDKAATSFNPATGQITVDPAFGAQILVGTAYMILNVSAVKRLLAKVEKELEVEWATMPVCQQVANLNPTNLTPGSVTPVFPTGGTLVRVILLAIIHAANQAAATHHISVIVQGQKAAGGYVNLVDLSALPSLALPVLDGTADGMTLVRDVSTLVDTSGVQYDFRYVVDSDNASAVNYTTSFVLVLVYRK